MPFVKTIHSKPEIRECISRRQPFVFRRGAHILGIVSAESYWQCLSTLCSPRNPWASLPLRFRCCMDEKEIPWETDCIYQDATLQEFDSYVKTGNSAVFDPSAAWVYCDYQDCVGVMNASEIQDTFRWDAIDDQCFIDPRMTIETAFWIGTKGACTQLHYDTYSMNFIVQLDGRKRWRISPPNHNTAEMRPTRVPYEESSVFSQVHLKKESNTTFNLEEIELQAGDLLFLPKHWWHDVECLETSLSINLWVPEASDDHDRILESICRTLFTCVHSQQHHHEASSSSSSSSSSWLNPTERALSFSEGLDLVRQSVGRHTLSAKEFFNAVSTRSVLDAIAANLQSHARR